jgi:hypothetical protein
MALIIGRHIRHDWRTWDDAQDQKTVKTLCSVTSQPHLCGIPAVTEHPLWLTRKSDGLKVWGWCWGCSRIFSRLVGDEIPPGLVHELHPVWEAAAMFSREVRKVSETQRIAGISPYKHPTKMPN